MHPVYQELDNCIADFIAKDTKAGLEASGELVTDSLGFPCWGISLAVSHTVCVSHCVSLTVSPCACSGQGGG